MRRSTSCNSCCSKYKNNPNNPIKTTRCTCSNSWSPTFSIVFFVFFICSFDLTDAALHNVNLYIEPPVVRRGQSVTLHCNYNLDGAPLYSAKFYRGQLEFFRYTPGEFPSTKVFPYPGINVDEQVSNATQAVIRNVGFILSGNFSCEVTADAPFFSTATAYASMQVVEFPDQRPQLFTEHSRYEPGDVLRANCSTPPARPRAELRFTINNLVVSSGETQYIRTVDNLIASRMSLKLQLQGIHFAAPSPHLLNGLSGSGTAYGRQSLGSGGAGPGIAGSLILRCTAQIGDLYQEYKEIELGTPQRADPVPARVTHSSGTGLKSFFDFYFSASSAPVLGRGLTATTVARTMAVSLLRTQQLLTISVAAGVIVAFHWLQSCRCR